MRFALILSVVFLAAACDRGGNNDTNNTNPDGTPTVLADLEEAEQCANFTVSSCPDDVMGAATTYFAGDLNIAGGTVSGFEYWYWYPNDVLADQSDDWEQGEPCWLTWEVFGDVVDEPDDCSGCLYELHMDLSFARSQSNCPTDLMNIEGNDQNGLVYKIRAGTDGNNSIRVFFPPSFSADNAANGTATNSRLEYTTRHFCAPVGSVTCRATE